MKAANQIISQTKRKFILFSLIGITVVIIISFFALNLHFRTIQKQSSMQELHTKLNSHFALVSDIAVLSEKFDDRLLDQNTVSTEFSNHIDKLKVRNRIFKEWLSSRSSQKISTVDLSESHKVYDKTVLFIKKAKDLLAHKNETRRQLRIKVRSITYNAREGIGEAIYSLSKNIAKEQQETLSQLKKIGFFVVLLCVLQIVLVWLLVFKPLYSTILLQHKKLGDALLMAESASRSKTDFLANISHEIRTPMTAIMGYADRLRKDALNQQEKEDAIRTIDQNASHLLSLIDEILDISKIEAGKFDFELARVNLSRLLNEVYSLIHVKAVEKNISLTFKNKGSIPEYIETDPKRVKQILFNIIGNAIKFTEQGSVELIVSTRISTNQLVILVKDTGCGISREQQSKLFQPFSQADTSANRRYGGTGLGLVLSKGLAQGMKGDINIINSQIGEGTTFEILLDMGQVDTEDFVSNFSTSISEASTMDCRQSDTLKNRHILVVDDAKENARLFQMYLADAGATTALAHDGNDALHIAKQQSFDLILLDLQMPGKDGFQVIKELRESTYDKPIVALTAHAMPEEKLKTKNAGFNGHITKPVKPDALIHSVANIIEHHQGQAL